MVSYYFEEFIEALCQLLWLHLILVNASRINLCSAGWMWTFQYTSRYGWMHMHTVETVNSWMNPCEAYGGTLLVYRMYYYAKEENKRVISPAVRFMPLLGSVTLNASPLQLTCCIKDYSGRKGQLRMEINTFTDEKDKGSGELKTMWW